MGREGSELERRGAAIEPVCGTAVVKVGGGF